MIRNEDSLPLQNSPTLIEHPHTSARQPLLHHHHAKRLVATSFLTTAFPLTYFFTPDTQFTALQYHLLVTALRFLDLDPKAADYLTPNPLSTSYTLSLCPRERLSSTGPELTT